MGENFIKFTRISWLIGIALLVMITNIAVSILYMVVYSYVIDPGHDPQYYNDSYSDCLSLIQHRCRHPSHVPCRLVGRPLVARQICG